MDWIKAGVGILIALTFFTMAAVVIILERGVRALLRLENATKDLQKDGERVLSTRELLASRAISEERAIFEEEERESVYEHGSMPRLVDDASLYEEHVKHFPDSQPANSNEVCTGWAEQDERLSKEEELAQLVNQDPKKQQSPVSWLDRYLE